LSAELRGGGLFWLGAEAWDTSKVLDIAPPGVPKVGCTGSYVRQYYSWFGLGLFRQTVLAFFSIRHTLAARDAARLPVAAG